ncbi:potassium channel family protein [Pseudovibrio ascidiaceicola]|uniref:potassium channel family protein n=1 Tax=Pseudovibrio ascidiaceicola TaxID=285279 RepID=UPI003D36921A
MNSPFFAKIYELNQKAKERAVRFTPYAPLTCGFLPALFYPYLDFSKREKECTIKSTPEQTILPIDTSVIFIVIPVFFLFLSIKYFMYATKQRNMRLSLSSNLWFLISSISITVFSFSVIYYMHGIKGAKIENLHWDYLYFSVITMTTIGYGEFHPCAASRPFAMLQGFIGFLFLPLMAVAFWETIEGLVSIRKSNSGEHRKIEIPLSKSERLTTFQKSKLRKIKANLRTQQPKRS